MKTSQARGACSLFLALLGLLVVLYLTSAVVTQIRPPKHVLPPLQVLEHHKTVSGSIRDPVEYHEWVHALKHNKILNIRGISQFRGEIDRFWVELEGGYLAIGKLSQPDTYVDFEFPNVSFQDPTLPDLIFPRRSNRMYQGWSDAATSAVAQVVFPYKKLPAILRPVSSDLIWSVPDFKTWTRLFKYYLMRERKVQLGLSPYYEKVQFFLPDTEYRDFLVKPSFFATNRKNFNEERALQVSDLLVFDFLVDDHDRQKSKNWFVDEHDNVIFWDGGKSFSHGPAGWEDCMDLLCGPDKWKDESISIPPTMSCAPICKFRTSTIATLTSLAPFGKKEDRLSYLTEQLLEGAPVFDYAFYYPIDSKRPRFQYVASDFFTSLDHRVAKFLGHVESCVREYGEEFVYADV